MKKMKKNARFVHIFTHTLEVGIEYRLYRFYFASGSSNSSNNSGNTLLEFIFSSFLPFILFVLKFLWIKLFFCIGNCSCYCRKASIFILQINRIINTAHQYIPKSTKSWQIQPIPTQTFAISLIIVNAEKNPNI